MATESTLSAEVSMGKKFMRELIESIIDVGSGLIIATLLQLFIFPFFGMYPTVWESFNIAIIFMCVSMFRSWSWRLFFRRFRENKKTNVA